MGVIRKRPDPSGAGTSGAVLVVVMAVVVNVAGETASDNAVRLGRLKRNGHAD